MHTLKQDNVSMLLHNLWGNSTRTPLHSSITELTAFTWFRFQQPTADSHNRRSEALKIHLNY